MSNSWAFWSAMGTLYHEMGQHQDAFGAYTNALAINSLLPQVWHNIGVLYTAGLYLVMRRSMVKLVLGLALLAHAANLLIFTLGRLTRGGTPVVPPGKEGLVSPFPDPVPQALVLTAIVILQVKHEEDQVLEAPAAVPKGPVHTP